MEMLLLVAGGLDDGVAKQALINAAMAKEDYVLRSREAIEVLWDTVRLGDKQTFDMVMKKIQTMDPPELGQFAKVFSRFINDYDEVRVPIRAVVQKVIAAKQAGGRPTKKRRT
ncbi:hypothetical protein PC118_g13032 [Phytophthora cactorum]|nr:hypothetical protein PC111_g12399 [Phytophthora cactorum]KAG2854326.1 hypothetical protein PC113_g13398 [Phytophthora cactorum]KAG2911961.1 hypothetical protein PC115_g12419 [Phytophthora cactorum]KAG2977188.1 hypothetical protein PC118_g13032 [Phytophthora cactorum]KAG3024986.1 hypothetical protein PC119_g8279 [Phytophthora cactorum]